MGTSLVSATDRIQVLLAEYNSLRAEILERNMVLNQFLTVAVTGGIAIFTIAAAGTGTFDVAVALFVLVPPVILMVFKILEFDTLAAARRVRELEGIINRLVGEELLIWENKNGLYRVGYAPRFKTATSAAVLLIVLTVMAFYQNLLMQGVHAVISWLR